MRTFPLSHFLVLSQASITLPFRDLYSTTAENKETSGPHNEENQKSGKVKNENGCVRLASELAVVLFENIHLKLKFYAALEQLNPEQLKHPSGHPQIVVLECGRRTVADNLQASNCIYITCPTPDDLLSKIKTIMENEHSDIGKCILNTVVIENLSAFFWDKRRLPRSMAVKWYGDLVARARDLTHQYKCNVLFTMWDKNYDRGFNSRFVSEPSPSRLDDMTYTPSEFFESISQIFALRASDSLRYVNSRWTSLT